MIKKKNMKNMKKFPIVPPKKLLTLPRTSSIINTLDVTYTLKASPWSIISYLLEIAQTQ